MERLASILIVALFLGSAFAATADGAMEKTLTPRISIQEQYNDNISLRRENRNSDWITVVSPGLSLNLEAADTRMTLGYEAGFSFYSDDSSRDTTRHQAQAAWDQRLTPHLRLQASDTFVRTEDLILETEVSDTFVRPEPLILEPEGQIEFRRQWGILYRNTGQVSLSYEFGAEDQITAGYRNRYWDDRSSLDEDSVSHEGFVNLDTWFTPQYGIGLTSRYNRGEFSRVNDFDQYGAGLTVNYRWQPTRRLYARYDLRYQDFEQADTGARTNDYRVHQGALGVSLSLGPYTDFDISGGYFLQDYLNGNQMDGATFSINFLTRTERASLRLAGSGGYDEDYFSSENLGSSKYAQVFATTDYLLTENLRMFVSASYRWEEFFGADTERDRKDEVWRGSGGFSLSFWRWLELSLEATHSERYSDELDFDFENNRVTLRLTGAYPYNF